MTARPRFSRSDIAATVATLLAFAVLVSLGVWQMQRLQWKEALIERMESRIAAPPVPLPTRIIRPDDWDFRPLRLQGRYRHEGSLYLAGRKHQGRLGYDLVTPLLRERGPAVLVNRGWVPESWRNDPPIQGDGSVAVEGVGRMPRAPGAFVPDNDPLANSWFSMDLPGMAAAAGLDAVAPVYVVATAETPSPNAAPQPHRVAPDLPNNHLGYAVTWFSLAGVLVVIFVIYMRGRHRGTAG